MQVNVKAMSRKHYRGISFLIPESDATRYVSLTPPCFLCLPAAARLREEASVQSPRSGGERPRQPPLLLRGPLQGRGQRQDRRGGRGRAAGVRARQLRHGGERGRRQEHGHRVGQRVRPGRQEQSRQVLRRIS